MLTTIEGSFIGWYPSPTGQLKYLQIQTVDRTQQVKIPKTLRPLLEQVLKSSTYLKLQVKIGHRHLKAISILILPSDTLPTIQHPPSDHAPTTKIQVCSKGSCRKRGSGQICAGLKALLQDHELQNSVVIEEVGCLKECKQAPNVRIKPSGKICHQASSHKVYQLLATALHK
jgi:(2Fe-2S) ferredoxin